jgi:hypothetical protein
MLRTEPRPCAAAYDKQVIHAATCCEIT